jgi:hypothetical protein
MDVALNDDHLRARTGHAAHVPATLKHITLERYQGQTPDRRYQL